MLLQPMRRDTDANGNDHGRKAKRPDPAQIPEAQEQNKGDHHYLGHALCFSALNVARSATSFSFDRKE
jgi:hypothetical protein